MPFDQVWIEWSILINDKGENILNIQTEDNSVKQATTGN